MSNVEFSNEDIKSIEAKHITYVTHQEGKYQDLHLVKEVVHLKDGRKIPRVKPWLDYERPFYITHKGMRNHNEKKDYEYLKNVQTYKSTQLNMPGQIDKLLREYSKQYNFGPYPRLRALARVPFLYGTDVSSSAWLKYDYRQRFPDTISKNTVAGADIETNVIEEDKDGQIICMSVTYKNRALLCYYKGWVSDVPNVIAETKRMAGEVPEMVEFMRSRGIQELDVRVCETPAQVVVNCIKALHDWKPDFMSFWNMDFDISRILKNLKDEGIDPKTVFSDPSVPRQFQFFDYNQAQAKTTTASGVTKSKAMEELWNWVTTPASFQCIDAMSIYRALRIAKGKEPSYALERILKKELNWKIKTASKVKMFTYLPNSEGRLEWRATGNLSVHERPPIGAIQSVMMAQDDDEPPVEFNRQYKGHLKLSIYPADAQLGDTYTVGETIETEKDVAKLVEKYTENMASKGGGALRRMVNGQPVKDLTVLKVGDILDVEMDFGKLKYKPAEHLNGIDWHKYMQGHSAETKIYYGLYNVIDSGRLEQLDEKIDDLSSSITMFSKYSDYKNFNSTPKRLCDDMHFWYLNRPDPCVIGSSSDQMVMDIDTYVVSHADWIVTLPSYMAGPNGIACVKDFPNYKSLIYGHVADLDKSM